MYIFFENFKVLSWKEKYRNYVYILVNLYIEEVLYYFYCI